MVLAPDPFEEDPVSRELPARRPGAERTISVGRRTTGPGGEPPHPPHSRAGTGAPAGWRRWALLILLSVVWLASGEARAERRVALVVGNDDYRAVGPLSKAVNDARSISDVLRDIGYDVVRAENLSRNAFFQKVREFEQKFSSGDTILFYFAGHGVAVDGKNYILFTDAEKIREGEQERLADEDFAAYSVDTLLSRSAWRRAGLRLVILDACRDNPFAAGGKRSVGATRGLARTETRSGGSTFVMMSAGEGQAALDTLGPDDPDPNSVFTRKLIPLLRRPGLTQVDLAKQLQADVSALAKTAGLVQEPAYYDGIIGTVAFNPAPAPDKATRPDGAGAGAAGSDALPNDPDAVARADYYAAKTLNSIAGWDIFLSKHQNGIYAEFARAERNRLATLQARATPDNTPIRPATLLAPPVTRPPDGRRDCPLTLERADVDDAGIARIVVRDACRSLSVLTLDYEQGPFTVGATAPDRAEFTFDFFAGPRPLTIRSDGDRAVTVQPRPWVLTGLAKAVAIWEGERQVELHAIENSGRVNSADDVTPANARSPDQARQRGAGFVTLLAPAAGGARLQTYTLRRSMTVRSVEFRLTTRDCRADAPSLRIKLLRYQNGVLTRAPGFQRLGATACGTFTGGDLDAWAPRAQALDLQLPF